MFLLLPNQQQQPTEGRSANRNVSLHRRLGLPQYSHYQPRRPTAAPILWSLCHDHSYRILFIIAVSIKNIVDMSGNKQFVKTRAYTSFIITDALRSSLVPSGESGEWRAYQQLRRSRSGLSYEEKKISTLLAQNFQRRPPVFCTFLVEPLVIYNCTLYNWKLSHRLRDIRLVSIPWPWNPG